MVFRPLLVLVLFVSADAAKILIYNPLFGQSHVNFIENLAQLLQDEGHDLTLLLTEASPGIKFNDGKFKKIRKHMYDIKYQSCRRTLAHPGLFDLLKAEKFDLGISEFFDTCGVGIFHQIGLHNTILTSSSLLLEYFSIWVGLPLTPSYVPSISASHSLEQLETSMLARFGNAAETFISTWIHRSFINGGDAALKERFPNIPPSSELAANSSLVFSNTEPLLNFPQPTLHKIIDVGGIGVPTPKKLDPEWDKILGKRTKSILISFGSVAKSVAMPPEFKASVAETIRQNPGITFIWKYEEPEDEFATSLKDVRNLIISKWTPQNDLLNDGRLSAFVTHGGMGSVLEAAISGTPLISIGLFADQKRNGLMAARHGTAIFFEKAKLASKKDFEEAVRKITSDPSYKKNAVRLSNLIKNRPFTPREIVARHVNFVATQGPFDVLNPASARLSFVQYYLIDVAAVVGLVLLSLIVIVLLILRRCFRGSQAHQKKE